MGSYIGQAQKAVAAKVTLPTGYSIIWSGEYEFMQRSQKRLMVSFP